MEKQELSEKTESPVEAVVRHFEELGFSVTATPNDYHVDYVIYDHEGRADDKFLFHRKGANTHPDPVETFEEAESYLHGSVKWDGCSNWHFDEQDRVMLHGCCKEDVERFGKIMGECWEWTKELCPHWIEL